MCNKILNVSLDGKCWYLKYVLILIFFQFDRAPKLVVMVTSKQHFNK